MSNPTPESSISDLSSQPLNKDPQQETPSSKDSSQVSASTNPQQSETQAPVMATTSNPQASPKTSNQGSPQSSMPNASNPERNCIENSSILFENYNVSPTNSQGLIPESSLFDKPSKLLERIAQQGGYFSRFSSRPPAFKNPQESKIQDSASEDSSILQTKGEPGAVEQPKKDTESEVSAESVKLLTSSSEETVQNTVHRISASLIECTDGVFPALLDVMKKAQDEKKDELIQLCALALKTLSQKTLPADANIKEAIDALCKVVRDSQDFKAMSDSLFAIRHFSRNDKVKRVTDLTLKILFSIEKTLRCGSLLVMECALDLAEAVLKERKGDDEMILKTLEIFEILFSLLEHGQEPIRKLACLVMSKITAECSDHPELIVENLDHLKNLLRMVDTDFSLARFHANTSQMMSMASSEVSQRLTQEEGKEFVEIRLEAYIKCLKNMIEDVKKKL